jgi:amino acid transporter
MAGDPRIVGPLSALGVTIGDAGQKFSASTPFQKSVGLSCFGAIVLGYIGALFPYLRDVPPLVLLGVGLVAAVFVVIGMRGARGMRDPFMAMTSIGTPALLAAGVWCLWGPQAFHNEAFLRLLAIPFALGFALRLFLSLRGVSGNAQRNVQRHIEQNQMVWRSARRR